MFGACFKGFSLYFRSRKRNLICIKTGLDTYLIRIQICTPLSRYPPPYDYRSSAPKQHNPGKKKSSNKIETKWNQRKERALCEMGPFGPYLMLSLSKRTTNTQTWTPRQRKETKTPARWASPRWAERGANHEDRRCFAFFGAFKKVYWKKHHIGVSKEEDTLNAHEHVTVGSRRAEPHQKQTTTKRIHQTFMFSKHFFIGKTTKSGSRSAQSVDPS